MISVLIAWIISALILWVLSLGFIPDFMRTYFTGDNQIISILIVAIVVGLISVTVVPLVKGLFKKSSPAVIFCLSVVVDAAALWLAGWLSFVPFSISFFPNAIIAAVILALVNVGAGFGDKK